MSRAEPPPLSDAQREIMEIIWRHGEITVSEVREQLERVGRSVARNTVQTTIVRLEDKGWLQHRRDGRTFVYSAAKPRKKSLGAKVASMVDRFFAGSPEEMVTALIEYRGLTSEEAQRIRKMIDESERLPDDKTRPPKQSSSTRARNKS